MKAMFLGFFFISSVLSIPISSSETKIVYRVNVHPKQFQKALGFLDLDVWGQTNDHVDVLSDYEFIHYLESLEWDYTIIIPDVDALVDHQKLHVPVADWFANYHNFEDIIDKAKELSAKYNATFVGSIGKTIEGRDTPVVRIPGDGKHGAVWIQCGIHAREWISPAACLYVFNSIFEQRSTGKLPSDVEIFWVPVVNPDGYSYTWASNRLWRKNRRSNPDGSHGVDLNRNWGSHWGEGGASPTPSSDTYRGKNAFSEPETSNIRDYISKVKSEGVDLRAGLDIHSYSQLVLRPYGWCYPEDQKPANEAELKTLGDNMAKAIKDTHGMIYTSEHAAELYIASGGADDWLFDMATSKRIGLTIELRDTGRYGFLLPADQIIPTGEELLQAILVFLKHASE